jgi:hypothetical protein
MQNSLHLVGDGDDVDVVIDVKHRFGIDISDEEAAAVETVGALHDLIEMKCGAAPTQVCLSQLAFYRLRRTAVEMGADGSITPDTPISVVAKIGRGSIGRTWKELSRRSALKLPRLETPFRSEPSAYPKLEYLAICTAFAAAMIVGIWVWEKTDLPRNAMAFWVAFLATIGCASLAWLAIHLAFRNIPLRLRTLGDLSREAAGQNFEALKGSRNCSAADRWQALVAILRNISSHKGPVTRETTFFAK